MASNLTEKQAGLVNEHDEFRNYAIPPQPHHEQNFPQGYYRRPLFLGPVTAISFGLMSALAGFAYIAPILTVINDVGLNPNIFWLSLVYTLIIAVGLTIIGRVTDAFGRRTQVSYFYTMVELVPMKYRFAGNGLMYAYTIPGSMFSPAIAVSFVDHTSGGWRSDYYILIAMNATALFFWVTVLQAPSSFGDLPSTLVSLVCGVCLEGGYIP